MEQPLRHLIEPEDLSVEEIYELIRLGKKMYENTPAYGSLCKGKILATLFFEPSTRTRFSFESAMLRLGGSILGFSDAETSSVKKGESLSDTMRCMSYYCDIAVMRHPREGAPKLASQHSTVPLINGGDGGHQHPTQTLTDLLTIHMYKGKVEGHTLAFCGDLKYGRTVHSLIRTMARFNTKRFILISPEELRLPSSLKRLIQSAHPDVTFVEADNLQDVVQEIDILYMTRIQKERFFNEEDYLKLKNSFILTPDKLVAAKPDMIIMHPLPRVNEIAYEVDADPRAVYFEQSNFGVYVRMALITKLLGVDADVRG